MTSNTNKQSNKQKYRTSRKNENRMSFIKLQNQKHKTNEKQVSFSKLANTTVMIRIQIYLLYKYINSNTCFFGHDT